MRKFAIILLFKGVLLSTSFHLNATQNVNKEHLNLLYSLIEREVYYDTQTPIDSIIAWSEKILHPPNIFFNSQQYFELEHQLIYAYIQRGDMSLAIDRSRYLYQKAKKDHNKLGVAFASCAMGDIYANTNMYEMAIESYVDALDKVKKTNYTYQWRFLPHLITVLLKEKQLEQAAIHLNTLESYVQKQPNHPTTFLYLLQKTIYHLINKEENQAKRFLELADNVCHANNEVYYHYLFDYTQAAYNGFIGEAEIALAQYNKLLENFSKTLTSNHYRQIITAQIYLNKKLGNKKDVCEIYKDLQHTIDTIASQSYARQINTLKAEYEIDQLELENSIEYNQFILYILFIVFTVFVLIMLLAFWLRKQRFKVIKSKEELEHSRRNAENAIRSKSVFLSNMSHEIRTPLNALSGFSSLLGQSELDIQTRQQCAEIIQQNSELLLKLINDVIDLSNLEFGKIQFNIEPHDAVSICRNVVETVDKVKQTSAELKFTTSHDYLTIETDNSRLQQVLINLLVNSTKFTNEGSIILELQKQSEHSLLFIVTDTGCGIQKEKQKEIFQRFEKLNEDKQGSGLGLSICQLIIEHIGGRIWIDPNYTEGTRFLFTHPVHQRSTHK